jgi:Tfp pilus assembly protein FimT
MKVETSQSGPRSDERGASLIDLLIVACILGIILAVAIPEARVVLDMQRLDAGASKLASKLMDARMNAIKRNRPAWLLVDASAKTLQVQTTDNSGSTINVGAAEPLPSGISIGGTATQVIFTSLGRVASTQTITLTGSSTGKTKTVTVSLVGEISVGQMN